MAQWEYRVLEQAYGAPDPSDLTRYTWYWADNLQEGTEGRLQQLGKEGWELVFVIEIEPGVANRRRLRYIFKRGS